MKVLHIFRSDPDETVRLLSSRWNDGTETTEFCLDQPPVDYDRLVTLIFENDRVLCWP
ncbi:MAG: hypothetical protein KKB20_00725 [Proteobacteria bacterium]|nr:hypothetical protein [Pseudomonadota bacterium]